jgi:hypothetical protein
MPFERTTEIILWWQISDLSGQFSDQATMHSAYYTDDILLFHVTSQIVSFPPHRFAVMPTNYNSPSRSIRCCPLYWINESFFNLIFDKISLNSSHKSYLCRSWSLLLIKVPFARDTASLNSLNSIIKTNYEKIWF